MSEQASNIPYHVSQLSDGRNTVGVTIEGEEYSLVASPSFPVAVNAARQFFRELRVSAILGVPFNREFLEQGQLKVAKAEDLQPPVYRIGVYVPTTVYNELTERGFRMSIPDPELNRRGITA